MNTLRNALVCVNLQKNYKKHQAVSGLTLSIPMGQVAVLVGPNGCGKTSAVETMLGIRKKDGGDVQILGQTMPTGRHRIRKTVRATLQNGSLHRQVTVREHLEYIGALYGSSWGQVQQTADSLGISHLAKRKFGTLSGGEQRRTMVAESLIGNPEFICLDEPTSGVDMESRALMWTAIRSSIRRRNAAVLMTTHDLTEAEEYADYIFVMKSGKLLTQGTSTQIIAQTGINWVAVIEDSRDSFVEPASDLAGRIILKGGGRTLVGSATLDECEQVRKMTLKINPEVTITIRESRLSDAYAALNSNQESQR